MTGSPLIPADFSGRVRLFPLPDLVLFPHVVQPLRIFEPRYIALLEDVLADDQLLGMALLQPGWERDYDGAPPIYPTVCVGRVISQTRQPDGCYNLLFAGGRRGTVQQERVTERGYREAHVQLVADRYRNSAPLGSPALRLKLLEAFHQLNPSGVASDPSIQALLRDEVPLGMLTDVIAYAVPLRLTDKLQLLAVADVDRRAQTLIEQLRQLTGSTQLHPPVPFPPEFSDN